jgi:Tfp pilus assembly protein PilN
MIQFNLLPDIKVQYLRAKHQKHLVMVASTLTIIVCVALMAVLAGVVFGVQKKSINDLTKDIDSAETELSETDDLTKILTVQNQLGALTGLHDEKPVANRVFGYMTQATPLNASISRLNTDFTGQTMTISGSADTLETVNTFVDSLKFTTYHTANDEETETMAFSEVVLSAFGRDSTGATYTITFKFDPLIFSEQEEITLTVPERITTRSTTEQPSALFESGGSN